MPGAKAAAEYLDWAIREGKLRPDSPIHIVDIEAEQKKRTKNDGPQPKTKFAIETDAPEVYARMNREKDRIIKRVGNKAVAVDLLARAWETLSDQIIDRIMASEEGNRA